MFITSILYLNLSLYNHIRVDEMFNIKSLIE